MLSSFNPGNNIYNSINSYRKRSNLNNLEGINFNRKLFLPQIRYNNDKNILNDLEYNNHSILNNSKNKKIKISKGVNTSRNIKIKNIYISSIVDKEKNNNDHSENKDYFKNHFKNILSKKNLFISKSCKNIFNNNISFFSQNKKEDNSLKISKIDINKNKSLPGLKKVKVSNNNKLENKNYNNFNHIYLEYKGKNNNKGYKKKTYIQINPHKLIDQLKTISMPLDMYGIKIFSQLDKYINRYSNDNNHREEYIKYVNKSRISNEQKENIYTDKLNLQGIYDKFILSEKNKYNFFVTKIFLSDIMDKVMKKMVEVRDSHNKIISREEIRQEYDKQLNNLKLFLDCKIKNKNKGKKILNKLNIIQNNINKDEGDYYIKKRDINYKNLICINIDHDDKLFALGKYPLGYYDKDTNYLMDNKSTINQKNKNKLTNSFSCVNIKENKSKEKTSLVLGPVTDRKKWEKSKIEEYLFKNKMNKILLNNNNKENNSKTSDKSFEFVQQLNLVDFDDIYKEIELQSQSNNFSAQNNNKNSIINLIISENDTFKKLKFDNRLSKKFLEIIRNQKSKNRTISSVTRDTKILQKEFKEINNKKIIKKNIIKDIIKEENNNNIQEDNNKLKHIKENIIEKILNINNIGKRNRSAGRITKNKFIIKDYSLNADKIFGIQDISIISNNSDIIENKNYNTESDNSNIRKIYFHNLKLNKRDISSSISTTINNILEIKNKNNLSNNQSEDNSKIIFDSINNSDRTINKKKNKIKKRKILVKNKKEKKELNKDLSNLKYLFFGKSGNVINEEENKEILNNNEILENKKNKNNKEKKITKRNMKKNKSQIKIDNNKKNISKNNRNKSNRIKSVKNNKKYESKIIQANLKDSNNISMDSDHSSIENKYYLTLFSNSSPTIPNNYAIITKSQSQKYYKMKNKTFYINEKYSNIHQITKRYKTCTNFKIKNISEYFKDFKGFKGFKAFNILNNINFKKRLQNIFAIRKKQKTTRKKQKIKKTGKFNDLTLEKLFNIENNIFIRKKLYKTVSYYKIYYKKNIERKDSISSLNYSNIFKQYGNKDKDKNKNKEKFNKIKRKSQKNFKIFLNNNDDGIINLNLLEEELEKIKKSKIKNEEKIKLIWEKKFELFKEYIKKNKNASFKEFLEKNDKEKEIDNLNFGLKLSNVDRINNFKRYIRTYRRKMKELRNEYNIVFKYPCIFDNGKYFQ